MRCPSSPGQGGESSPGSSFRNFAHITVRPLLLVEGVDAAGPQGSAMLLIVVDRRGGKHREFRRDVERKPSVRVAKRTFDVSRGGRAREDEPEITRSFRQRNQQLIRFGGHT